MAKLPTGRRRVPLRPHLELAQFVDVAQVVPTHPDVVDQAKSIDWSGTMYGNGPTPAMGPNFAGAGDCEAVRWANSTILVTTLRGSAPVIPTLDQVWSIYQTQNPDFDPTGSSDTNGPGSSADRGMDSQTLLEYLHTTGDPNGRKVVAFATVNLADEAEVDAAIDLFDEIWYDVIVQDAQQQQFAAGQSWDWDPSSAEDGGHAVTGVRYNDQALRARTGFITWTRETDMTELYYQQGVETAWAVIWPEHLGQKGLNEPALADAYQDITGRPFPGQSDA